MSETMAQMVLKWMSENNSNVIGYANAHNLDICELWKMINGK